MAFKTEVKEIYPIFVSAKYCWSIHSNVVRLGKHAPSKQRKATHTQTLQFQVTFMHVLLVQHLQSVFFQHIFWYGPTADTACVQRRQKNWLKYTGFTELN